MIGLVVGLLYGLLGAYGFRNNGFLIQLIVFVITVALCMFSVLLSINNKAYKAFKVLDEKGVCDELIEVYKSCNKRMTATHHVVLASYYMNMDRIDEAQRELYLASLGEMTSDFIKAFYLQILINVKIIQGCFDEAAKIYSDNRQTIQSYCDNHNDVYSVALYGSGAILCAKQGNFDEAAALLDKTEPAIQRDKELVFNKNISLMIVYLIKGDVQAADKIKQDMLSDLETFSGFELRSSKMIYTNTINYVQMRYDPRAQMQ